MKKLFLILLLCFTGYSALAQRDTVIQPPPTDTGKPTLRPAVKRTVRRIAVIDTLKRRLADDSTRVADSLARADSVNPAIIDSAVALPSPVKKTAQPVIVKKPFDSFYKKLLDNPFLRTTAKPIYLIINERERQSKDEMFYLLLGLLAFLGFVKLIFSRYFTNVFRLFFQPSFRQKQTREQLLQSRLPSLLLNLFFIFSGGAYVSFLIAYYNLTHLDFWLILLYSSSALMLLYAGKFIILSFAGWVFNVKEATNTYIFSVYHINKIIGVILIPFTLIIAFSQPLIINISITISLLLILLLFIYRYLVSYSSVRRDLKVSGLHFFFYICAFEIIPLLLIYKTLINYLDNSL